MARLRTRLVALLDRRRRVVVGAVLGWAAVIGAGAGAAPTDQDWLGVPSLGDILMIVVGVAALVGVVLLVAMLFSLRKGGDAEVPERKPMWPSLVILALLLIVAFRFPRADERPPEVEVPQAAQVDGPELALRRPVIGEGELVALLAVSAVAVAAIIWSRRRIAVVGDLPEDEGRAAELEPIVGRAARRLALGDDPRSAVIEAYASLEESLRSLGLGRRLSETPTEHISRVLSRSSLAAPPILRLAALYEVARFSEHGVTVDDQRTAASSLGDVHRSLRSERVTG